MNSYRSRSRGRRNSSPSSNTTESLSINSGRDSRTESSATLDIADNEHSIRPLSPPRPINASDTANSNLIESPFHDEVATTLNEMSTEQIDESEEVDSEEIEAEEADDESEEVEAEEVDDESQEDDEFLMSRHDDESDDDAESIDSNDSESDDDVHDDWVPTKMNFSNVRVTVSSEDIGISSKLELVKCLEIIKENIKVKKGSLHFRPNSPTPSDATKNFLIYANETFFAEILRIINENEARDGIQNRTTMKELEHVMKAILFCAFQHCKWLYSFFCHV